MTTDIYDITIIGGGPTGLFAGFYAGMRQAKTKIIESLPHIGGQLSLLYPEKYIYDVAGFPKIKAQELIDQLEEQIKPFHHTICLGEEVLMFDKKSDLIHIKTSKGTHLTKTLIIACGKGSFQPKRLTLPHIDHHEGKQLHYFIQDINQFRDKDIMICGGGDSAVDWALMLEDIARQVYLVHRRHEFRAHEHSINSLKQSKISVKTPFIVESLLENNGILDSVEINNPREDIRETIHIDDLIVNYGFSSSLGPIKEWPIEKKRQTILTNSSTETSNSGVYAIGDISSYEGKVHLIATGFGEAPIAVNHAMNYINPKERIQPMHSTSLFEQDS